MSTTTHTRSIHIDAPVERVFEHVQDPENFYAAMAATSPQDPPKLLDVDVKPEGVGSTYQWTFHLWSLLYVGGTMTREEYVPNEQSADSRPLGPFTLSSREWCASVGRAVTRRPLCARGAFVHWQCSTTRRTFERWRPNVPVNGGGLLDHVGCSRTDKMKEQADEKGSPVRAGS